MRKNRQILYLDKDHNLANQVKMLLEWDGYDVEITSDASQCLKMLHNVIVDILIIDFSTPQNFGLGLLENLNKIPIRPPSIMVFQHQDLQLIAAVLKQGCTDYVIKDQLPRKYFDHLNTCIFQLLEKFGSERKTAVCGQYLPTTDLYSPWFSKFTSWEYFPKKDIVHLAPLDSDLIHSQRTVPALSLHRFLNGIHPEDRNFVSQQIDLSLQKQLPVEYDFRCIRENGETSNFFMRTAIETDADGDVYRIYGICQDMAEHCSIEPGLRQAASFLELTKDAVLIADQSDRIVSINPAFIEITGLSKSDVLGKSTAILNTDLLGNNMFQELTNTQQQENFWQGELMIRHKSGRTFPVWLSASLTKDDLNTHFQSVYVFRDITKQKEKQALIQYQANYDELTRLPNRNLFHDRLTTALKHAQRNKTCVALMLLDLDKFKWINDSLGHQAGDRLLQETAKILEKSVRDSDTIARLGGDEFTIILPELEKGTDAELIAQKIFQSFSKPIMIDEHEIFISGSLGIAVYPNDGTESTVLQKHADKAMYVAKQQGRNHYRYFTPSIQKQAEKRLDLITKMRDAIENEEFSLHYQPIIDLTTNKVSCAEALLRWNQPESGFIAPDEFIPVAEETGLIRPIGNWVIQSVAENMQRWACLGLKPINISLNKSVAQFSMDDCDNRWLKILAENHVSPQNITFEVTENLFIDETRGYFKIIEKLQRKGVQISLDSFGTGYSSLSFLNRYPVDILKIDRSFIQGFNSNPNHTQLIETIFTLAEKMGIKVIAAGVENKEQLNFLKHQCQFAQGFYLCKPLPIQKFESFLRQF